MATCITIIGPKYDGSLVPPNVVVDTNIFIDSIKSGDRHQKAAERFFKQCAANGTNLYITGTVYGELAHSVEIVLTKEFAVKNGICISDHKYGGPYGYKYLQGDIEVIDPLYFGKVDTERDKILTSFLNLVEVLPDCDSFELTKKSLYLQRKFDGCIESRDAAILATATEFGINTIATGDHGYARVDNINILAPLKGKYIHEKSSTSYVGWVDLLS